ncbi:MAG: acyl-CoA dehydratase activase [Bacillales bacterium]|nr:acyl-CoA dehydratase activase [Bacillales bacterium]
MKLGLDIGSTTIKCVVIQNEEIIYSTYRRHYSHIKDNMLEILKEIEAKYPSYNFVMAISGSAGLGISKDLEIEFIQEVYAERIAVNHFYPEADCVIELGGEDAKILFLSDGVEVRMNGSCAGGTGAFIDQMATLLDISMEDLNEIAKNKTKDYSIASRCGVFAKTDIQAFLNQGISKSDIASSIFKAVVNQTIGGLAQGRDITGKVIYLGGPLTFLPELKKTFDEILKVDGVCPKNSLYYVALGSAMKAKNEVDLKELINRLESYESSGNYFHLQPLFNNEKELEEFRKRHSLAHVDSLPINDYDGPFYLGIDAGSTTLKVVLIDKDDNIRFEKYLTNNGNPVEVLKNILTEIYELKPNIKINGACSTGYGEDLMRNAFSLDGGIVETMAHLKAAQHFNPKVDFIIDIGGQDIKCFKIENGITTNIFLNEACSSGCGSFLQTFANALGYSIEEFAQIGLLAKKPVDLGSRCTVFMNSSVKQAQKDGATIDNISAGLSISVVKNAIYKVIRVSSLEQLGKNIVVQGGTFYNEAVLRAFERELNLEVTRPNIAGLMGAFGAALQAKSLGLNSSNILSLEDIKNFKHEVKNIKCGGCNNHCSLSVNFFNKNKRYISGNRCEKPVTNNVVDSSLNIYEYIRQRLLDYKPIPGKRGKVGIPLCLNMYELYPFWYSFLSCLGFEVYNSGFSSEKMFFKGQHTIPSDTECYPAKLVHGHIESLIDQGFDFIFYPSMSYNIDEKISDNHYNCPIVAYYPEQIHNNVKKVQGIKYFYDYVGIHNPRYFEKRIYSLMKKLFDDISKKEISLACKKAYKEYDKYLLDIKNKGQEIIAKARENNKHIVVLCGRPYHVDPLVNHGIDKLICGLDKVIINELSISYLEGKEKRGVLNQWTYHARLYNAARYVSKQEDMSLVQLVSFGCGLDAITTDEVREILEGNHKFYTQIKIDENANLGAVKIRLRSLFSALKGGKKDGK